MTDPRHDVCGRQDVRARRLFQRRRAARRKPRRTRKRNRLRIVLRPCGRRHSFRGRLRVGRACSVRQRTARRAAAAEKRRSGYAGYGGLDNVTFGKTDRNIADNDSPIASEGWLEQASAAAGDDAAAMPDPEPKPFYAEETPDDRADDRQINCTIPSLPLRPLPS